jgi:hypothetical protein
MRETGNENQTLETEMETKWKPLETKPVFWKRDGNEGLFTWKRQ